MAVQRVFRTLLALLIAAAILSLASAAGAVDNPVYTAPSSTPVAVDSAEVRSVGAAPSVAGPAGQQVANQTLVRTGSETTQLLVIGTLLVVIGAGLLVVRRPPRHRRG